MPKPPYKSPERALNDTVLDRLDDILGSESLPSGENNAQYRALRALFLEEIRPRDLLETYWVREIVHNIWSANRARRAQRAVINLARAGAIAEIRTKYTGDMFRSADFVAAYLNQQDLARKVFRPMMKKMKLRERDLQALCFYHSLGSYEALERSAENSNKQIAAIYREIERKRDEATARRLRERASKIEDAVIEDDETTLESDGDEPGDEAVPFIYDPDITR